MLKKWGFMKKFNFIQNLKSNILGLYNKNKKVFFACTALSVILVILVFSVMFSGTKKKTDKSKINSNATTISVSEYALSIENKLKNMIEKLDSVKDVSVFVMVDSSPKIEYLTETTTDTKTTENGTNSTISETVVFEKNGSISTPVVVTTIMPKVTGVLITVKGIDAMTKLSIINSVSIVLNIDESCISILQER